MMTVSRNPVKGPQWVLEITVPLFSPRNGPSTGFYLWWAKRFLRSYVPNIRSQNISQSVSLGRTKDVTRGDRRRRYVRRYVCCGLRLLADFLGLSVSQIAPNAWRTFIGAEILWGRRVGESISLHWTNFFYCYRPHHIASSKGTYHFTIKEKDLKLVFDMLDSNRN